jgi:uncharacterized protein
VQSSIDYTLGANLENLTLTGAAFIGKLSHRCATYTDPMGARRPDPTHLDLAAMAAEGASLSGQWAASELERWHAMQTPPPGATPEPVQWSVRGELRRAASRSPQTWLYLHAQAVAWPTCQRCLQPFSQPLVVDRALRFVDGDAQAEALDADSEDDVLALAPALDLRTLVEDELLQHPICRGAALHGTGIPGRR